MQHGYKDLSEVADEAGHTFAAAGFMDAFTSLESFVLGSIPVQQAGLTRICWKNKLLFMVCNLITWDSTGVRIHQA